MTWFRTDDSFYSHPKTLMALRACPTSITLWTMAGAWCADHLTDGFVPHDVPKTFLPSGWLRASRALVAARLWVDCTRNGEAGWQYHDWLEYQPSREAVLAKRAADAARQAAYRLRQQSRRNGGSNGVTQAPSHTVTGQTSHGVTNSAPTLPTHTTFGGVGVGGVRTNVEVPGNNDQNQSLGIDENQRDAPPARWTPPPPAIGAIRERLAQSARRTRSDGNRRETSAFEELRRVTTDPTPPLDDDPTDGA